MLSFLRKVKFFTLKMPLEHKIRPLKIKIGYIKNLEGSAFVEMGNTKVLCGVKLEVGVPNFLRGSGEGWITANYSMFPKTSKEVDRRAIEISRIIGRSLRAVVNRKIFPNYTCVVNCEVLEADGGTRIASIIGGFCSIYQCFLSMEKTGKIEKLPIKEYLGAISIGLLKNKIIVDMNYEQDSQADVDMNIVMTENEKIIELQVSSEKENVTLDFNKLKEMFEIGKEAIKEVIKIEKEAIKNQLLR